MVTKRLLVIDDDRSLQALFGVLFKRAGFETDFAADGAEGLAMLDRSEYDGVILDLMMPRTTGFEVLAEIAKSRPELLRKVIVTSGASQRLIDKVDSTAVHAVVRKPFDIDRLIEAASSCVR